MPRTGRGGTRQGLPGQAYGNRSDLNAPKLPVETATGQGYGVAAEQQAAQRAIPVAAQPVAATPAPAPAPQAQAPAQAGALSSAMNTPTSYPGELPFLHPTERPDEPTTAGIASGPGPGPEVLAMGPTSLTQTLQGMAMNTNAPARLMDLANAAQVLGL